MALFTGFSGFFKQRGKAAKGFFLKKISFISVMFVVLLAFGLAFVLISCDNGTTGGGNISSLSGRYTNQMYGMSFNFNANGAFSFSVQGYEMYSGTYSVAGNTVTLTVSGQRIGSLTIVNSTTLRDQDGILYSK